MPKPLLRVLLTFAVALSLVLVGSESISLAEEAPVAQSSEAAGDTATAESGTVADDLSWEKELDAWVGEWLVGPMVKVLFFDFGTKKYLGVSIPLVVAWLTAGALFLTLRMKFINLRAFWHAIRVTKGDYDDPTDVGEVSHFQALASALSATVGLGNIAGVAIAVGTGGPGAVFWMILSGFIGMTSKFTECTLAQMYRKIAPDGQVLGGPMRYLSIGLSEIGLGWLGKILAVLFTVLCIGGSFGGGCTFQVVQSLGVVREHVVVLQDKPWLYGIALVIMVGTVIIGGIRRIASTAEKVVPIMCLVYVLAAVAVLAKNYDHIGWAFGEILSQAFQWQSAYGGLLGVMVIGIKRAAFSNEAGVGSAAIAHSAARTDHPVREGIVALLEPFIDTIVICTMTGLVIVITQAYDTELFPANKVIIDKNQGAHLTSLAFATVISWFPKVLAVTAFLFAYSTMISWSYYGERCWTNLFGDRASMSYRLIFLVFVFLGSVISATNILDFSDLMILSMALPNMLGLFLLSGKVSRALNDYWKSYEAGAFETYTGSRGKQ
jgi:AGCS family alanine or glycine:cation symporter